MAPQEYEERVKCQKRVMGWDGMGKEKGLSEPEFYGDFVNKLKKKLTKADYSDQFRKIYHSLQTYWI